MAKRTRSSSQSSGSAGLLWGVGGGLVGVAVIVGGLIIFSRSGTTATAAEAVALPSPVITSDPQSLPPASTPTVATTSETPVVVASVAPDKVGGPGKGERTVEPVDPEAVKWLEDFAGKSAALTKRIQSLDPTTALATLREPSLKRDLLRHEILRQASPGDLKKFLKTAAEKEFLNEFLSQTAWLEDFAGSGEFERPLNGILALTTIALHDADVRKPSLEQRLATSVALEIARTKSTPVKAIGVYDYYRDRGRAGKLYPGFADFDVWEMRYAVCASRSVDELTWIGDRASFSPYGARSAAWQVHYLGDSPFGDSIQSAWYYLPWQGDLNYTQRTVRVGGVCGSLSTTGAVTANADGIPAITMGEPGHCAFAVRPKRGRWVDGNSVDGNHRSPHRSYFLNNWSDLFAGDRAWMSNGLEAAQLLAFASETLPKDDRANRLRWIEQAVKQDPWHYGYASELCELLVQQNATREQRETWAKEFVNTMATVPETVWQLIRRLTNDKSPADERAAFQKIWLSIYRTPVDDQVNSYPIDNVVAELFKQRAGDAQGLFADILETTLGNDKIFPRFLDGCQKMAEKDTKLQQAMLEGLATAAKTQGDKGGEALKNLCSKGILLAEKAADKASFNSLSDIAKSFTSEKFNVNHQPYKGELLSEGGMIQISSTCRYDSPLAHRGVLQSQGGKFHTDKEDNPFVIVELGKQGTLSGIAIVNIDGQNSARAVPMKVSVSMDGKAWTQVFKTARNEKVWQIDLGSKHPMAKFVKIEGDYPDKRQDFLHLNGIYIYGKRAQ